ncbi:MAG: gliding motility-associated C-terminal domain-containing protein, partial [Bacteroidales bacterium]|nr:gliding motility-associated C-terminal domain-containing protein [Bacteroidales bacterium]
FRAYCDLSVGASGDCKTRIEADIRVENCNRVYFASGFVPDGHTKTFGPIGVEDTARQYYFAVFNRSGEMLYSTHEFSQGWDGRFKGQWVPPGVYVYVFRETYEQFEWTRRGTVSVLR